MYVCIYNYVLYIYIKLEFLPLLTTDSVFLLDPASLLSFLFSLCRSRMGLALCAAGRQILFALMLLLYLGSGKFSVSYLHCSLFP